MAAVVATVPDESLRSRYQDLVEQLPIATSPDVVDKQVHLSLGLKIDVEFLEYLEPRAARQWTLGPGRHPLPDCIPGMARIPLGSAPLGVGAQIGDVGEADFAWWIRRCRGRSEWRTGKFARPPSGCQPAPDRAAAWFQPPRS
jgi:hypothetical protein